MAEGIPSPLGRPLGGATEELRPMGSCERTVLIGTSMELLSDVHVKKGELCARGTLGL